MMMPSAFHRAASTRYRVPGVLCFSRTWGLVLGAWCFLLAVPAPAQELPSSVADAVVDFLNDPRRLHRSGPTRIEAGEVVRQDLAVLDGDLEVAGRIEGSALVVNGDARLRPGAEVTGDLLVVGGTVAGLDSASVGGEVVSYPGRLRYIREDDRIVRAPRAPGARESPEAEPPGWGSSDLLITTGKSYNRVEGLPVIFGPRIQTAGSNPLRVHALAVYRTESGLTLDTDKLGYYVRAEQFLGGRRALRAGVTAHSLVEPIEEWHVSDLENALATFVLHRDFRDHYEREGYSAFVIYQPQAGPLSLSLEGRWEEHSSAGVGSPWSLFDNAEPWRPQPLVGGGQLGSIGLMAGYDTRSDAPDPATGWYLRGRLEQAVHAELDRPEAFLPPVDGVPVSLPRDESGPFTAGMLDLRRYNRVDAESRLNFRFVLGGALDGSPLPPQRQHALGGEGSLPGYALFSLDCGARDQLVYRVADGPAAGAAPFFPRYGCDAFGLLQAEFRGKLNFRLRLDGAPWNDDEEQGWGWGWDMAPDWTVFADAGRGWAFGGRPDTDLRVDVGAGLLVDRLGIFLAKGLSGGGVNFFVRLGPRF